MKIVLFDYAFDQKKPGITGLSDLVWNWARELTALGDDVHIVAPYLEGTKPPAGATPHIFKLPIIGYRNILGYLLIMLSGWKAIRRIDNIDIIHCPEYLSTAVFSLFTKKTPIILTIPGNIYERIANGNPFDWPTTQVFKLAARISARRCAKIIVTSAEMWRWWKMTGADETRMVLIPHGVDTTLFRPIPAARVRLGLPEDKRIILYVGRLSHEKGLQFLFKAYQQVRAEIPNLELHLVGSGIFRPHLEKYSNQFGFQPEIVFHDWVDQPDLPAYYSAADVTVLPSLSEGMPRTMVETLACGSPFLGTEITGIIDHIKDGNNGFLVAPSDSDALARKLIAILKNPEHSKQVGENGRQYVLKYLSWHKVVNEVRDAVYCHRSPC